MTHLAFNLKPTFRVMLMDLREASHGLHIATASRVFFVNPVWQTDVEAQVCGSKICRARF